MSGDAYLIDTNVLIDYLAGAIPPENERIDEVLRDDFTLSVISKIEFLGWTGYLDDPEELDDARSFIEAAEIVPVSDEIGERAIELRRQHGVPLADSVIAATALDRNATLVTRNATDFEAVPSLDLDNPHDVEIDGTSE